MKTKIFILSLACLALGTGCSLEEKPYGFFSSGNFYQTESDAESGLMYAYNALNYLEYLRGIWYLGDIPTETMRAKLSEPGDIHHLQNWQVTSNTELTQYYFKYCFIGVNRANTVIYRVWQSNLSQDVKDRVIGEAYFLRAWNYFNLVRAYGRVPYYTSPVSSSDEATGRLAESIEEIYDLITGDLWKAADMLKVNKVFGRIDKVGVEALLSKVYIHLASSIEHSAPGYTDMRRQPDVMYDSAAVFSRRVVFDYNSDYDFDTNLLDIYDVEKPDGPEHIFIMAIDRSGTHEGQYSKIPLQFLPHNSGTDIYIKYSDGTLQKGNGNGWGVFIPEDSFVEGTFQVNDLRRKELIHNTFYDAQGNEVTNAPYLEGYFSVKYVDPQFKGEWTSGRPFLIRYSDIALVFAEAAGITEGLPVLNKIRTRAGIDPWADDRFTDLKKFREEVINERTRELAFEGHRLYDLRRTASVTTTVGEASGLTEEQAAFYPIPQREIDLNPNVGSGNNNF